VGVLWLCMPPASPPVRAPGPRRPGRAGAEVRRAGGPAAAVAGDRVGGAAQRHLRSGRGDHSRQRHRQRAPVVTRAARAGPRLPRPAQSPTRALARRRGPPRRRLRHAPALRRAGGAGAARRGRPRLRCRRGPAAGSPSWGGLGEGALARLCAGSPAQSAWSLLWSRSCCCSRWAALAAVRRRHKCGWRRQPAQVSPAAGLLIRVWPQGSGA